MEKEITAAAATIYPRDFDPIIRKAADDFYQLVMSSCEDYLRDNVEWNIGSHIAMLERENQRMRTELFEVDRALGCMSLGQEVRLKTIAEQQERYRQASGEVWRLRAEIAATVAACSDIAAGQGHGPSGTAQPPSEDH